MLNDADSYQGGGEVDGEAGGKVKDALFSKLKRNVKADFNSKGQVAWRKEAREDFDFEAGEQLNDEDKAILRDAKRPIVIFNRVGTTVDSVAGQEVGNRQELQFLLRTPGAVANCFSSEKVRRQHLNEMADYAALIRPTRLRTATRIAAQRPCHLDTHPPHCPKSLAKQRRRR